LTDRIEASGKLFGVSLETLALRTDTVDGIPGIIVQTMKHILERGKKRRYFQSIWQYYTD